METVKSILHDPQAAIGKSVSLSGWVRTARDVKACAFIELNDGTFFKNVQIVCEEGMENFKDVVKTTLGSAIEVTTEAAPAETPGT